MSSHNIPRWFNPQLKHLLNHFHSLCCIIHKCYVCGVECSSNGFMDYCVDKPHQALMDKWNSTWQLVQDKFVDIGTSEKERSTNIVLSFEAATTSRGSEKEFIHLEGSRVNTVIWSGRITKSSLVIPNWWAIRALGKGSPVVDRYGYPTIHLL